MVRERAFSNWLRFAELRPRVLHFGLSVVRPCTGQKRHGHFEQAHDKVGQIHNLVEVEQPWRYGQEQPSHAVEQ